METQIRAQKLDNGNWYWRVLVGPDGETYADGEETTRDEAVEKAARNRDEYESKNA